MMRRVEQRNWLYVINDNAPEDKSRVTGRYMFFSKDRAKLLSLAEEILKDFNLKYAKMPLECFGTEYILCIFDEFGRYKYHLRKYEDEGVKYRYWKLLKKR